MTEEITPPEQKPEPTESTLVIDMPFLDKLEEEEKKQINAKFMEMQTQTNKVIASMQKEINQLKGKTEEVEKESLLKEFDALELDPQHFKGLGVQEIKQVIASFKKSGKGLKVKKVDKGKDKPFTGTTIFNPKTGKREPLHQ